jgi:hypothetical protein
VTGKTFGCNVYEYVRVRQVCSDGRELRTTCKMSLKFFLRESESWCLCVRVYLGGVVEVR